MNELQPLVEFLGARTPTRWVEQALQRQELLLIDHAHCEKKAASTALSLMFRYPHHMHLVERLSKLAREELRHFEQVLRFLQQRNIQYRHITPSRYAKRLNALIRAHEPAKCVDTLIMGAFIEARSCERFSVLVPHLDDELARFYAGLLYSEKRHFEGYLHFAQEFSEEPIELHIERFRIAENELITSIDTDFRFHSGALESLGGCDNLSIKLDTFEGAN